MMKIVLCFLSLLALVGCGEQGGQSNDGIVCPLYAPDSRHTVDIVTSEAVPEKAIIYLDGIPTYNECNEVPNEKPPFVRVSRNKQGLSIIVHHKYFYNVPPNSTSIQIFDAGDCEVAPVSFFAAAVPLEYEMTYPHGVQCKTQEYTAKAVVNKAARE